MRRQGPCRLPGGEKLLERRGSLCFEGAAVPFDNPTATVLDTVGEQLPAISVIVPTFNRPTKVERCAAAMSRLDYPVDRFELVLIDDGGSAALEPYIAKATATIDIRLVRLAHAGPAAARNAGARAARYELLAFTDDDCAPRPDWLRKLAQYHREAPSAALGGHVVNALTADPYATTTQMIIDYLCRHYNRDPARARFATTSNLALPAQAFRELGGFDLTFPRPGGEDRELCDRWVNDGRALHYAYDAIVDHYHAMSLPSFCRQHFNYGRGAYSFRRVRTQRRAGAVEIESLAFYRELLSLPLRQERVRAWLVALIVLSQLANAGGFFAELAHAQLARRRLRVSATRDS